METSGKAAALAAEGIISAKARNITPSATMAISAKVKEMRKAGEDIISFDIGEPDFDTPEPVKKAAKHAIDSNFTRYTAEAGISELREAVCEKFRRENGVRCLPEQVVISSGAKQSLYNAFLATLDAGDEVIIPSPYWVSYVEQVKLAGGKPVIVPCNESDFSLDAEAIERAITPKTKMVLINSPNNPTGAVYSEKAQRALLDAVLPYKRALVLSDEVYERINFTGEPHASFAALSNEALSRTITINAASKTYAMTGWRIGYATAPLQVAKAMAAIQGHTTSAPNSIAQKAALSALNEGNEASNAMAAEYRTRRDLVVKRLSEMEGVRLFRPQGTFYAFPNISGLYGSKFSSSTGFAQYALEKAKVSVVPGIAFGNDSCVRMSFATTREKIEEGMRRLSRLLYGK